MASAAAVTLIDRGWHVEIALPAEALTGGLAVFRDVFPGARAVAFGYGKRTFFTAKTDSLSEYLLGPFPARRRSRRPASARPRRYLMRAKTFWS